MELEINGWYLIQNLNSFTCMGWLSHHQRKNWDTNHTIDRAYNIKWDYNRFIIEKGNKLFDKCHDFDRWTENNVDIRKKLKKWNFCHMAGILPYQHTLYVYVNVCMYTYKM